MRPGRGARRPRAQSHRGTFAPARKGETSADVTGRDALSSRVAEIAERGRGLRLFSSVMARDLNPSLTVPPGRMGLIRYYVVRWPRWAPVGHLGKHPPEGLVRVRSIAPDRVRLE